MQKNTKSRVFRKFQFRGVDLDKLLDLNNDQLLDLLTARARRRFHRGLKRSKCDPTSLKSHLILYY